MNSLTSPQSSNGLKSNRAQQIRQRAKLLAGCDVLNRADFESLESRRLMSGTATTVASAGTNQAYRGIAYSPANLVWSGSATTFGLTGTPFTNVTLPVPQMQVNGNTAVTSPRLNRRRNVNGVCRISVRVSVPYLPVEKLGAEPTCH